MRTHPTHRSAYGLFGETTSHLNLPRSPLTKVVAEMEAAQRVTVRKPDMTNLSKSSQKLLVMKALRPSLVSAESLNKKLLASEFAGQETDNPGWLEVYERVDKLQEDMPLNTKAKAEDNKPQQPVFRFKGRSSRYKKAINIQKVNAPLSALQTNRFGKKTADSEIRPRTN